MRFPKARDMANTPPTLQVPDTKQLPHNLASEIQNQSLSITVKWNKITFYRRGMDSLFELNSLSIGAPLYLIR